MKSNSASIFPVSFSEIPFFPVSTSPAHCFQAFSSVCHVYHFPFSQKKSRSTHCSVPGFFFHLTQYPGVFPTSTRVHILPQPHTIPMWGCPPFLYHSSIGRHPIRLQSFMATNIFRHPPLCISVSLDSWRVTPGQRECTLAFWWILSNRPSKYCTKLYQSHFFVFANLKDDGFSRFNLQSLLWGRLAPFSRLQPIVFLSLQEYVLPAVYSSSHTVKVSRTYEMFEVLQKKSLRPGGGGEYWL